MPSPNFISYILYNIQRKNKRETKEIINLFLNIEERGEMLCQKIEDADVSDLVMIAVG
jgi:hypothetical protein